MSSRAPIPPPTPELRRAYERNLRVYYVFKLLSEMWLLIPIFVAFLLLDRGLSVGQVALIESPFWLMATLAEVPTGAVADRWGRRVSLLLGAATTTIAMFAFGLADTLPLILGSYMLWATAFTFTSGADAALLYDTLRQLRREREFERIAGRGAALSALGVLVATLAGGPVAGAVGMQATVFLSAGTMALLAVATALFHEPPHHEMGAAPVSYLRGIREAGRTIRQRPAVLALMPVGAILTTCPMVMIILVQPFLLSHDFTVGWEFSLLQLPLWVGSALGGLLAFRLLRLGGAPGALAIVALLATIGFAGAAAWDHVGALAFIALIPLARSVTAPLTIGYINHRVPSGQRATVLSLNLMVYSVALVPIMPILGLVADRLDLPATFAVAAALVGGISLIGGLNWLRVHRAHPLGGERIAVPRTPEHAPGAPREPGPAVSREDRP
jgi:predicted MFS family arabinose efflux permease